MDSLSNKQNKHNAKGKNKKDFKIKKKKRETKSETDKTSNYSEFSNLSLRSKLLKPVKDESIEDVEEEAESIDSGCVADIIGSNSDTIHWSQESDVIINEYTFVKSLLQHMPWYDGRNQNEKQVKRETPLYKMPKFVERQQKNAAEDREERRQQKRDSKKSWKEKKEAANKNVSKRSGECGSESIRQDDGVAPVSDDDEHEKPISRSVVTKNLPLDERRAAVEAQLNYLKANKGSLPAFKWAKLIPKLNKRVSLIIKKQQVEESRGTKETKTKLNPQVNTSLPAKREKKVKPAKIYNQSGDLVFNKFDFTSAGDGVSRSDADKPKNLHKIMSSIIKEKQKIDNLSKSSNLEAASARMEGGLWDNAMKRADGERVKDDPKRIKKTLKNKSSKKQASAIKWNEHEKMVVKTANDREMKKKYNVQKRKESSKKFKKGKGKSNSKKKSAGF